MFARLLALACLLSCSALTVRSEHLPGARATVGVYFKTGAAASNLSLHTMRNELEEIMQPAGLDLDWLGVGDSTTASRVIWVELKGACEASTGPVEKFKNRTALASTAVQDGKVLPFSWVDCNAVERFLGPSLERFNLADRNILYGKALARLIAHEFFHVLAATEGHTSGGVSKTAFTVADLLAPEIAFQPEAIAMLRTEPGLPAAEIAKVEPAYDPVFEYEPAIQSEEAFTLR